MKYVLYYNNIESWDGVCETTIIKIFDSQEEAEQYRDELLKPSLEFNKIKEKFHEECLQKIRNFFESNRKSLLMASLNLHGKKDVDLKRIVLWADDPIKVKNWVDAIIDKFIKNNSYPTSYFYKTSWDNKNSYLYTLFDVDSLETEPLVLENTLIVPNPYYENGGGYSSSGFGIQTVE